MREIKFKAWIKSLEVMTDVLAINFEDETVLLKGYERDTWATFDQVILLEYTGLKDINGVEIYEGDIVRIYSEEEYRTVDMLDEVIFKNGCFTTKKHEYDFYYCGGDALEKKGNIYKYPNLLKE